MKDKTIDFSDCPEITSQMFAQAIVRRGLKPIPINEFASILKKVRQQARKARIKKSDVVTAIKEARKSK